MTSTIKRHPFCYIITAVSCNSFGTDYRKKLFQLTEEIKIIPVSFILLEYGLKAARCAPQFSKR